MKDNLTDTCNCGERNRYFHFSTTEDGGRVEVMSCNKYVVCPPYNDVVEKNKELIYALSQCVEAMEFTRQYVGKKMLPPIKGWSWYDADVVARELTLQPKIKEYINE